MRALLGLGIVLAALFAATSERGRAQLGRRPPRRDPRGLQERRAQLYPLAVRWAHAFGVPALWLAAIVRAESGWQPEIENHDPRAEARGGAWGLGQVTFTTAKGLIERSAKPGGPLARYGQALTAWNPRDPRSLLSPSLNLMLASFAIARLIEQFGANFDLVSAAYHSGAGTVQDAIASGAGVPAGLGDRGRKQWAKYQHARERERAAEAVA